MPDAVVTALAVQRRQGLSVTERIVGLRPLRMLLLLDNCEHVTAMIARLVTAVAGAVRRGHHPHDQPRAARRGRRAGAPGAAAAGPDARGH